MTLRGKKITQTPIIKQIYLMTKIARLIVLLAVMLLELSVFIMLLKRHQYGFVPFTVLIQMSSDFENSPKELFLKSFGKHGT